MATDKWISVKEEDAAGMLALNPKTLRKYVITGKLPISYLKLNYRAFEYNLIDIEDYKKSRRIMAIK